MDKITLERIQFLHPKIRQEVKAAYEYVNNKLLGKSVRLRFAYTLRSFAQQDEMYKQGRTVLFDKNGRRLGKLTNAKGGQSIHNYGLAFDIVMLYDKNNDGVFEVASWDMMADRDKDGTPDWMEVVMYFKKLGWVWGGDWKTLPDGPHFEKTFGYTYKMLLAKLNAGDASTENIDGTTYKWVNI